MSAKGTPPTLFAGFHRVRVVDLIVLLVPCLTPVLGLLATNPVGVPHAERLFGAAILLWLIVSGLTVLAVWLGADRTTTILTAFVSVFVVTRGDGFVNQFGYGVGLPLAVVLVALVAVVAFRLKTTPIANILIWAMAVALMSGPIIEGIETLSAYGSSSRAEIDPLRVDLDQHRPDIWLVILDGHPGLRAIEQDFDPGASEALEVRLRSADFDVPESAWTAYWTTDYSVSSLLEMTSPTNSTQRSKATTQDLSEVIGGDNRLMSVLKSSGYTTYMVESGWSGSACGPSFDHCVASHWMDESMFLLLSPSIFKGITLETFGYSFTAGSMRTMDWVLDNAHHLSNDEAPSFVFAHVLAPHPPFFLDSTCDLVYANDRSSATFQRSGVTEEKRHEYLEEQMACTERFVIELADRVDERSVVVVVSDHGTDRRNQLERSADTWASADVIERMNTLVAVKGLGECPITEHVILPNVMSHVLSCLSDDEIELSEPVFHLSPSVELDEDSFERLVAFADASN